MRKFVTLITMLFVSVAVFAQKDVLIVDNFSRASNVGGALVNSLRGKVMEGIVKTDRLQVKDINTEASLKDLISTDAGSVVNESSLTAMRTSDAKFLLQGNVLSYSTTRKTNDNGKVSYQADVNYSLSIIDIKTGNVLGSKSIKDLGTGDSQDAALASGGNDVIRQMKHLVDEFFKLGGTIVEITASNQKKQEAEKVYVSLGSLAGILKGQAFEVFVEGEVAGKKMKKKIGELKAEAVEGDELTLCKVNKGGKEIQIAFNEKGTIIVQTVVKKSIFDVVQDL